MNIQISRTTSTDNHFTSLITQLDRELNSRYGELQKSYDKYNSIAHNNTVVIAFDGKQPVGCGCFKPYNENMVEIKRMFVHKEYRGKGVSKLVLKALESWAVELGFGNAILETGIGQHEAIGLYTSCGYEKIENFGQYAGNTNSICMKKKLA